MTHLEQQRLTALRRYWASPRGEKQNRQKEAILATAKALAEEKRK